MGLRKFVDVSAISALLVINLTQFYSTGITLWLGLISTYSSERENYHIFELG